MNEENNKDILNTENPNRTGWGSLNIKTKWAQSYVYMMLPVFALIELICIIADVTYLAIGKEIVFVNFIINIILFALTTTTLVLLIKFTKAGYFLNIALFICQSIFVVILLQNMPTEGAVNSVLNDYLIILILWALPNIIYFYFRRGFFIKNEAKDKELKIKYKSVERSVLFFKEVSFGVCLEKINNFNMPNKYLKFYIFYIIPISIFAYLLADSNLKYNIYYDIFSLLLCLITYYYLLKLDKKGYYLTIICQSALLIIDIINTFYIEPYFTKTINTESYIFLIISAILTLITVIYFIKRKEIFGIIKK